MTPHPDPSRYDVEALRERVRHHRDGRVDDSIPALAGADPGLCGIALALPDGTVRVSTEADVTVSVQSAVKPFLFALALLDTEGGALDRVGIEPTGESFDAILLESGTGRPPNPMVNAGAIVTASLVTGAGPEERMDRIAAGLAAFAGRELDVDDDIAHDEHLLGDRNHALAHLLRAEGQLRASADDAVAVYARACATLVDAETLAVMGATLAGGGVNPRTGARVVPERVARDVVSVMATCGMYDGSGRWMRAVGVPAKSSVSGGVVLAARGRLGAAVVSPPLDEQGTSVRGRLASEALSDELHLHAFAR